MKIKIGDQAFDSNDQIISIYLSDGELEVVKGMEKGGVYTHYPNNISDDEILQHHRALSEEVELE